MVDVPQKNDYEDLMEAVQTQETYWVLGRSIIDVIAVKNYSDDSKGFLLHSKLALAEGTEIIYAMDQIHAI